jgi:drug/metabolite transporter (DMT)-like permease
MYVMGLDECARVSRSKHLSPSGPAEKIAGVFCYPRKDKAEMSTINLYIVTTLIWSATWLAITFQLGMVPPAVSVFWRFALSALILLAYAYWKRLRLRFSGHDHLWMAVQGFFMFGPSYICVYLAEQHLASGLVAVVFSLIVFWNILFMRVFFAAPFDPMAVIAAALGVAGLALVFWPEIGSISTSSDAALGLALAVLGTLFSALGNMAAVKNQLRRIPIVPLNGWGMMYGTIFLGLYVEVSGFEFTFDWSPEYMMSLLYLALFGSVLAFGGYLTLLKQIGPERAGYIGVAVPVVALLLSTLFEDLQWQAPMVLGVLLCVAGNVLILRGTERRAAAS